MVTYEEQKNIRFITSVTKIRTINKYSGNEKRKNGDECIVRNFQYLYSPSIIKAIKLGTAG
jgi:hypothetical protein